MMDRLLEETDGSSPNALRRRLQAVKKSRRRSRFELWALTELPAYRLGLVLGYIFSVYFGVSALIAGVPAFTLAAPDGWTTGWAWLLIISGPIGVVGTLHDSPRFRAIELVGSVLQAGTLFVYAGTVLFIAYSTIDETRIASGAALAWLTSNALIRMLLLIIKVTADRKAKREGKTHG